MSALDPRLLLKQSLVKERMNGINLTTLQPDFYKIIKEFISKSSGDDRHTMETSLNCLVMGRKAKISRLAEALNQEPEIRDKMTTEERAYFDVISNATVDFHKETML